MVPYTETTPDPPTADLAWSQVPYPVLVADAAAVVVHANAAAGLVFPDARPGSAMADTVPGWLVSAHARCTTPLPAQRPPTGAATAQGPVGDRSYEAHPTPP